jgi:hypothetical protein
VVLEVIGAGGSTVVVTGGGVVVTYTAVVVLEVEEDVALLEVVDDVIDTTDPLKLATIYAVLLRVFVLFAESDSPSGIPVEMPS